MAIRIPIVSDFSNKGIQSAIKQFKSLEGAGAKTAFVIRKAWLPVSAAIGAAAAASYDAAQAAASDEKSQIALANSLKRTTGATDAQVAAIEEQITAMQMATGFADDQLRGAYARLAQSGMDAATAQKALTTALDVSRGTGKDLMTIIGGMAKGFNGQFGSLTRLGVKFSSTTLETKDFNSALRDLNNTFGGQAADYAGTFAGKMDILRQRFGEIWETLGYKLLPVFEKLAEYIGKFLDLVGEKGLGSALKDTASNALKSLMHNADGTVSGFGRLRNGAAHLLNGVNRLVNPIGHVFNGLGIIDWNTNNLVKTIDNKAIPAIEDLTLGANGLANNFLMVGQSIELTQEYLNNFMGPVASRNLEELENYQWKFKNGFDWASDSASNFGRATESAMQQGETAAQKFLKTLAEAKTSIADTFKGMFDIGSMYDPERGLKSFMSGVTGLVAKIKQYGKDLVQLQAKGLGPAAIQGIMSMDLLTGAQLARELLDAPNMKKNIGLLNYSYNAVANTAATVGQGLAFGQVTGTTVNQYITVPNADPDGVVRALRRYQRVNGAIPIRVNGAA